MFVCKRLSVKTFPQIERRIKIRSKINCIIGRVFPYPLLFTPNINKSIPIFHSLTNTKPLLLQEWKRNEISAYLPLFRDDSVSVWPPPPIGGDTNGKHTHNTNQQTNKKLSSLMTMPKSSTCSFFFLNKNAFSCVLIFSLKLTFKIWKNERKSFKTLKSKTKSKSILTE